MKAGFYEVKAFEAFDKVYGVHPVMNKICRTCGAESIFHLKNSNRYKYTGLIKELHNKPECHLCSDWNGCGSDCTYSGAECLICGNKEGY